MCDAVGLYHGALCGRRHKCRPRRSALPQSCDPILEGLYNRPHSRSTCQPCFTAYYSCRLGPVGCTDVDHLNNFMGTNGITNEPAVGGRGQLRSRLREYMLTTRHLLRTHARERLQKVLSPELQAEVVYTVDSCWLRHVLFLRDAEAGFRVRIAMSLGSAVFPPSELIVPQAIMVIVTGVVLNAGKLIAKDKAFGLDTLLSTMYLPRDTAVRTLLSIP